MSYTNGVLTVIAVLLFAINVKLWTWEDISRRGDLIAARSLDNDEKKREARQRFLRNMPVVWVQGGSIDAEVSGSVSVDR